MTLSEFDKAIEKAVHALANFLNSLNPIELDAARCIIHWWLDDFEKRGPAAGKLLQQIANGCLR